ncbi:YiiX/YebB-like N1pC/P60 family cysteine hydrolase [Clostridiaceae bacterium M8S5]|nr:YiiX/YebB-like N1pC/P60 family cysteine hydrolase [Clostridiaceae bacterium M8S5]
MKNSFKIFLSLLLCFVVFGTSSITHASDTSSTAPKVITDNEYAQLQSSYNKLIDHANANDIPLGLTFDIFTKEYLATGYDSVNEYTNVYYNMLKEVPKNTEVHTDSVILTSKGNPFSWHYNTGTSLPRKANYSKYNLLNVCQPGDVIYEANGGFGITGHIAIVEGKFYDATQNQYYIRVIEANQHGVCRGVLDDDRVDTQRDYIYRVTSATAENKNNAVEFCKSQFGKPYILDFAKHTSADTKSWYCSELVWAAYMREGINIETQYWLNEPGVSPRDISRSDKVTLININK